MKLFVWDLHGVLEKGTEQAAIYISNQVLHDFQYKERFINNDNQYIFGKRWYEYFEYLLPKESHTRHLELAEACFLKADSSPEIFIDYISPNDYSHMVLEEISNYHRQILISNTKPSSLNVFLKALKMSKYFNKDNSFAVYRHNKNTRKSKCDILKNFLNGKMFDDIIIIGDTENDMDLVNVSGGKTYLFTSPGKDHKNIFAHYKIHDLREVLREI